MKSCLINDLSQRLERVEERITDSCQSVNRNREEVKLIVVTKRHSPAMVASLIPLGVADIGENYVQELVDKQANLGDIAEDFHWHLIGPLQRRKARYLPRRISMIHSVDRFEVAQTLDTIFVRAQQKLPVLLQVNLSGEESKSGWRFIDGNPTKEFLSEVEEMITFLGLTVSGLMTMPPYGGDKESSRAYYVALRKLADKLNRHFQKAIFTEFSIGSSFDYETAIQEGATYVRIGEAILGPRE